MSYPKNNWQDLPNQTTPITAGRLNNMENGIANSDGAIGVNEYSSSATYSVGDYCLYNNKLYKCKTAISTAEAWNSAHWTEIKIITEIDNTQTNLTNATKTSLQTTEAKELTITNCAGVNGKLSIKSGETYQAQYEGKNQIGLIDLASTTNSGVTYSILNNILSINNTATAKVNIQRVNYKLSSNTTKTLKLYIESGTFTNGVIGFSFRDSSDTQIDYIQIESGNTTQTKQIDMSSLDHIYLYITNGSVFSNAEIKFLLSDNASDNYEPYTGGNPAPSPDYQQKVENVGSNINLFDYSSNILDNCLLNGTAMKITSDNNCKLSYIKCKPNTIYTISRRSPMATRFQVGTTENTPALDVMLLSLQQVNNATTESITITTPTNANYIVIRFIYNEIADYETYAKTIKIEEGNKATGYSKYGCGRVDFKVQNKNLLDNNSLQQGALNLGANGAETSSTTRVRSDFIVVSPNTSYYASNTDSIVNQFGIGYYDENYNYISGLSGGGWINFPFGFTTLSNAKYIRAVFRNSNNTNITPDLAYKIQIEQGSTATTYVEGKSQLVTVSLPANVELCKIGTYKDYIYKSGDKWYNHKEISKLVLDGTETWTYQSEYSRFYTSLTENALSTERANSKSNYYIYGNTETTDGVFFISTNNLLLIRNESITSSADFKTWLSTHNTTVYYVLETPVEEEITDTDTLEGLYQIEHLLMYEGYTTIECLNEVKPDIQVEYLYNNEINNYWGSVVDALSERIHLLETGD